MEIFFLLFMIILVVGWVSQAASKGGSSGPMALSRSDQVFASVAPGIIPADSADAPVRKATKADQQAPIAVRFEPPEHALPEEVGVIGYRGTRGADIGSAVVAMAVEGYYRIDQLENNDESAEGTQNAPERRGARRNQEWVLRLVPDKSPEDLDPWRRGLYDAMFSQGPEISLDAAKQLMAPAAQQMRQGLDAGAFEKGWYQSAGGRPARTAVGSALMAQTKGFHEYLGRAEQRQMRYEEAAGIFSKYLPWAVGLGVTEQWAKHFAGIAEQAEADGMTDVLMVYWMSDLMWWTGMSMMLTDGAMFAGFGDAIGEMGAAIGDFAGDIGDFGADLFGDVGGDLGDGGGFFDGDGGDGGGFFDGGGDDGGFFDGIGDLFN